tara:strand:+ start:12456 stop:12989 length:534 start_codon:yes stop_codon:yes gene_type:complete
MTTKAKIKPENEVNAYLFYAQRLLHLLTSASLLESQADKMAIRASVCLSLKQAWQSWLKELSSYTGKDIADYTALILPENNSHPEVQLLNEVHKQPKNWLSKLVEFFEPRLNTPTVLDSSVDDELAVNLASTKINLFQLDEEHLELTDKTSEDERLKQVIIEFKAYINAVRSRQAEW